MFNATKTIAAATALALAGTAANAGSPDEIVVNQQGDASILVSFDDLNIESEAGMNVLEGRIRGAVKKVCGYTTGRQTLRESMAYRKCANTATSSALASIDPAGPTRVAVRNLPAKPKK